MAKNRLKYRFEDMVNPNPIGDNALSPEALYYQRSLYDEVAYPKNVRDPLNTWAGKIYYGKIDKVQNTIVPLAQNLVPITSATAPGLFALDVVVGAFEAFVEHMGKAIRRQAVNPLGNRKLLEVRAAGAYVDSTRIYERYIQQVFDSFNRALSPKNKNSIKDFATFTEHFSAHLKMVASYTPITKTNYLLTSNVNILSSGLTISIDAEGEPEDDAYKYKNFVNDPNFKFFVNCAKNLGFIVDKNIPWRLTFDLFSKASLHYIENRYSPIHGLLTKENFFPAYYSPCYLTDIEDIKKIIVNSYRRFVELNPFIEERVVKSNSDKFKVDLITRNNFAPNAPIVDTVLSDKYMSDLYLALRHTEAQKPFRLTEKFRNEISEIYLMQPNKILTPLQNVASYVNIRFRDYIYEDNYFTYASEDAIKYLLGLDNRS